MEASYGKFFSGDKLVLHEQVRFQAERVDKKDGGIVVCLKQLIVPIFDMLWIGVMDGSCNFKETWDFLGCTVLAIFPAQDAVAFKEWEEDDWVALKIVFVEQKYFKRTVAIEPASW